MARLGADLTKKNMKKMHAKYLEEHILIIKSFCRLDVIVKLVSRRWPYNQPARASHKTPRNVATFCSSFAVACSDLGGWGINR